MRLAISCCQDLSRCVFGRVLTQQMAVLRSRNRKRLKK